jgi:hypothetical protein
VSKRNVEFTTTEVLLPFFPFLLVIITTPFAAREPYKAAADAPFNIEIVSISSGLISCALFPKSKPPEILLPVAVCELEIGTPSTTNSGC